MFLHLYVQVSERIRTLRAEGDRGATAVEYGLLVGLIGVVIIGTVTTLGGNLSDMFDGIANEIHAPTP